jgi:hypothetical protein
MATGQTPWNQTDIEFDPGQQANPRTTYPFCTEISTVVEKPDNRSMLGAAVRAVR